MRDKFKGLGVAIITPFQEDFRIDFEGFTRVLAHTYAQGEGVNYWVVQGTTGESATLNSSEKREVLQHALGQKPSDMPIMYGIGGNNTNAILEEIKHTDLQQVDALLSVSPYYNKPSQEGLFQHYRQVADASPCPVLLYNVPGRTGSNISAETILRLAEHPNIFGVKEAGFDLQQWNQIARYKPDDFLLISGNDMVTLSQMAIGGEGLISVMANAFPKIIRRAIEAALKNDFASARKELFRLINIDPLMYVESNPVGVKQVLAELGLCQAQVRMPLQAASADLKQKIKEVMEAEPLP